MSNLNIVSPNFNDLPIELKYKILLPTAYTDIMNYCSLNIDSDAICDDTYFWILKLDHDFTIQAKNGKIFIPSQYLKSNVQQGHYIYETWLHGITQKPQTLLNFKVPDQVCDKYEQYQDVIMFRIVSNGYQSGSLDDLIKFSAICDDLPLLKSIAQNYGMSDVIWLNAGMYAMQYTRINIMDWLYQTQGRKFFSNYDITRYIGDPQSSDTDTVLNWLLQHNIRLSQENIMTALIHNRLSIVQWAHNHGVKLPDYPDSLPFKAFEVTLYLIQHGNYPTQSILDDNLRSIILHRIPYNASQIIEIINTLAQVGIFPSLEVINLARHNGITEIIEWASQYPIYNKSVRQTVPINQYRNRSTMQPSEHRYRK